MEEPSATNYCGGVITYDNNCRGFGGDFEVRRRRKMENQEFDYESTREELREQRREKRRRRRKRFGRFVWRPIVKPLLILLLILWVLLFLYHLAITNHMYRTGFDNGVNFPVVRWLESYIYVEVDIVSELAEAGYTGLPVSKGEKGVLVTKSALIIGDVMLSPYNKNSYVPTFDKDPLMTTCTLTLISQPGEVNAINSAFIVYDVSSQEKLDDVLAIIRKYCNYPLVDYTFDHDLDGWEGGK